jgi:hypothetical protein
MFPQKRKINDAKHSKPSLNTRVPIFPFISLHFHNTEKGYSVGNRLKGLYNGDCERFFGNIAEAEIGGNRLK